MIYENYLENPNDARIIVQKLFLQHKHVAAKKRAMKWYNAKTGLQADIVRLKTANVSILVEGIRLEEQQQSKVVIM
jgi:hypothetical protein